MTSASQIQEMVRDGLARAGARLSPSGSVVTGTIVRRSGADETVYPPVPGSDTHYNFVGLRLMSSAADMSSTEAVGREVTVMVSHPVESSSGERIEPSTGDRVVFDGRRYSVSSVDEQSPGGVPLYWLCRCEVTG